MDFVLDASVTMRWLLPSESTTDQRYANAVLESLRQREAAVPNLWHLEVASVLLGVERRGDISIAVSEGFASQLQKLPVTVDAQTSNRAWAHSLALARSYGLSAYDAAYLELAIREGLPLASLDKTLRKACAKAGVPLFVIV